MSVAHGQLTADGKLSKELELRYIHTSQHRCQHLQSFEHGSGALADAGVQQRFGQSGIGLRGGMGMGSDADSGSSEFESTGVQSAVEMGRRHPGGLGLGSGRGPGDEGRGYIVVAAVVAGTTESAVASA